LASGQVRCQVGRTERSIAGELTRIDFWRPSATPGRAKTHVGATASRDGPPPRRPRWDHPRVRTRCLTPAQALAGQNCRPGSSGTAPERCPFQTTALHATAMARNPVPGPSRARKRVSGPHGIPGRCPTSPGEPYTTAAARPPLARLVLLVFPPFQARAHSPPPFFSLSQPVAPRSAPPVRPLRRS
jgi:hypothetical protein